MRLYVPGNHFPVRGHVLMPQRRVAVQGLRMETAQGSDDLPVM